MYFTSTVLLVPNHYYTNRQIHAKASMPLRSNNKSSTMGHRLTNNKSSKEQSYTNNIYKTDIQIGQAKSVKHHSKKLQRKKIIYLSKYTYTVAQL